MQLIWGRQNPTYRDSGCPQDKMKTKWALGRKNTVYPVGLTFTPKGWGNGSRSSTCWNTAGHQWVSTELLNREPTILHWGFGKEKEIHSPFHVPQYQFLPEIIKFPLKLRKRAYKSLALLQHPSTLKRHCIECLFYNLERRMQQTEFH